MPRANRDWRQSLAPPPWSSGLQQHCYSHPKHSPGPITTPAYPNNHSRRETLAPGSCHHAKPPHLIPEIAAPQTQPGKGRRWDARKALLSKSSKPSTGIHDHLCCIFRHGKQSLRKSLNTGATKRWMKNLPGRGKQGDAGLIPSWKTQL